MSLPAGVPSPADLRAVTLDPASTSTHPPSAGPPAHDASASVVPEEAPASASLAPSATAEPGAGFRLGPPVWIAAVAAAIAVGALAVAWQAQGRVARLEQELVRRQQDAQGLAAESRVLSRQAQDSAREAVSKVALLEARVAEVTVQRGQLEDLIQSLARSRDENVLVDIEAALRVAQQQAALTGSAEPLVAALRQADERLARGAQPRLEGVRRAIARDIERVRAVGVPDVAQLVLRIDEVVRLAGEIPLLAAVEQGRVSSASAESTVSRPPAAGAVELPEPAGPWDFAARWAQLRALASVLGAQTLDELRSLVRISRVDRPEALLLAPDQAFFLRENLRLRLLSARLALLGRQFDGARAELQGVQGLLERYFDPASRRTVSALEVVRSVAQQSRVVPLPRPDETLAALATLSAIPGR
jgi:uroporphyrin-III C-methyltransferase